MFCLRFDEIEWSLVYYIYRVVVSSSSYRIEDMICGIYLGYMSKSSPEKYSSIGHTYLSLPKKKLPQTGTNLIFCLRNMYVNHYDSM